MLSPFGLRSFGHSFVIRASSFNRLTRSDRRPQATTALSLGKLGRRDRPQRLQLAVTQIDLDGLAVEDLLREFLRRSADRSGIGLVLLEAGLHREADLQGLPLF